MSARKCIIKQRFAWARGLVRGHSESSSMPAVCFKPDFLEGGMHLLQLQKGDYVII